ncbi:MAG: carbohydrate porin [Deltaproteobacteria bacterium]|nr:carbohydrate porin [Deltaproteobacteria bacterium]
MMALCGILLHLTAGSLSFAQSGEENRGFEKWDVCFPQSLEQYLSETVTFHGSVVGYYQQYANATLENQGHKENFTACISPQLIGVWKPTAQGTLHVRLRYTNNRVDLAQEGIVLANLLETNVGDKDNGRLRLQKLYYSHTFDGDQAFVVFGKTDGETFLDLNAFANDSRTQFIGQPLVDNPVLDDEDEYAPFIAVGGTPSKDLHLLLLGQSSSHPMNDNVAAKSVWEQMLKGPFVAGQAAFTPGIQGLGGHYRLYGWVKSYDHPRLAAPGYEKGWGIGMSVDQYVAPDFGVFARLAYQNRDVYETPWFWSAGTRVTGLLPGREADIFGFGISGLKANPDTPHQGTEIHLETYYRIRLSKHFFISPDLQYVMNPLGNNDETAIFAAMLRGEFRF